MKQSLTEQVKEKLKIDILSGRYAPGDHLPSLRRMAEMYHVSRSVINAVVVDLESSGYIRIVPTKWIEVADWRTEGSLLVLTNLLTLGLFDEQQLEDLLEARCFLELECVKIACRNAEEEQLRRLRDLIGEEERETDPAMRAALDLQFHCSVCRMSGNMVYGIVMKEFEKSASPLTERFYQEPEVLTYTLEQHRRIAEAIRTHNEIEAEREMRLLLDHGANVTRKLLQRRNDIGQV